MGAAVLSGGPWLIVFIMALRAQMSLRMMAIRMTLGGWPVSATLPEGFDDRIVLSGDKGCHVGGIAQAFAAADGASLSPECSAFAVEGSHAEQWRGRRRVSWPSSRMSASRVWAKTGPTPGTERSRRLRGPCVRLRRLLRPWPGRSAGYPP